MIYDVVVHRSWKSVMNTVLKDVGARPIRPWRYIDDTATTIGVLVDYPHSEQKLTLDLRETEEFALCDVLVRKV